jgi:putative thiamine transport system ATP-binding protein
MNGLHLTDLRIRHGETTLVSLTAQVTPGQVLTVMGASGSGKSTLLAALIGTLPRTFAMTGAIALNGVDVTRLPTRARKMGILFQDDVLFPHLSVGGNLGFGLPARAPDRAGRIDAALADVGLAGFADRDPATLSGGQRARVSLLRTLLAAPQALLLDEPFSRLDAALREQVRSFVLDRARAQGLPIVLVTHDAEDARAAGGPVVTPLGVPVAI